MRRRRKETEVARRIKGGNEKEGVLCWPREVQSSIRVARESSGLRLSYCRAKETLSRLVLFGDRAVAGPETRIHVQKCAGVPGQRGVGCLRHCG